MFDAYRAASGGFMIGAAILAALAATAAPGSDRDQIRAYAGHSMWDAMPGARGFLSTRLARSALRRLGPSDRRFLNQLQVGSNVDLDGDFAFATVCRAHCCPCEHAVIAVNSATGDLGLGLWKERSVTWVWQGNRSKAAPEALPCSVVRAFYNPTMPISDRDDKRCWRKVSAQ